MISIEARGRLGNHMFQFAFGLAASTRLRTDFAMNDELLAPAFRLGPWGSAARRAARSVRFRVGKRLGPTRVVKVDNDDDPGVVRNSVVDRVHYAGFFQSARYFDDVQHAVRTAFEPHRRHVDAFEERYGEMARSPYICCHVRRTDYERGGIALPVSYYRECLGRVRAQSNAPVVFVGDDLDEVKRELGAEPGVHLEHNDEIVDLQLLINAAFVVTSNSSFGWWGSWLGQPERPVYAPKYWTGFRIGTESPHSILPTAWHQVAVLAD